MKQALGKCYKQVFKNYVCKLCGTAELMYMYMQQ